MLGPRGLGIFTCCAHTVTPVQAVLPAICRLHAKEVKELKEGTLRAGEPATARPRQDRRSQDSFISDVCTVPPAGEEEPLLIVA